MMLAAESASAAPDSRELKAREHFVAGRYQEALDLFARLYAETLHPIYLRNIGRCYQNLGDPDKAINSFRDYLRKAKALTADERKEVEGFIAEMEEMKRQKEAHAAASSGPPAGATAGTIEPVTPIAKAPPPAGNASATVVLTPSPTPPPEESPAIYKRWWFWAIIGGVVAAGVGTAAALGVFTKTEDASCMPGFKC
jgi:tetratricopeptide (TPR) repeat protein